MPGRAIPPSVYLRCLPKPIPPGGDHEIREVRPSATLLVVTVLLVTTTCARFVIAQGLFGTISGVITDSSGAVVSGATVKVINLDTNVTDI